jgi:hypothetical protein
LFHSWASAIPASDRLGKVLPMRRIIRNGEKTTTFCLGGWHMGEGDPALAEQMIERALELGVRFFDTARGYQKGGFPWRPLKQIILISGRCIPFLPGKM